MAIYETVCVLRQDLTTQQVADFVKEYKQILTDNGSKIFKEENWGLRNLAYKIKKNKKGHYILLEMESPVNAIKEFERKLGLNEDVLRYMTVKRKAKSESPSPAMMQKDYRDSKEERK